MKVRQSKVTYSVEASVLCAYSMGKYLNKVKTRNCFSTSLVCVTGASLKSDFLGHYKPVDISVKGVAGNNDTVSSGTTLRCFKTRCGKTVNIPAHVYNMPATDIRLESPQSMILTLIGINHARIDGYNIEWILPDDRIIGIPIDPH